MEDQADSEAVVLWKGGRRTSTLPVGKEGARVVVTEYFSLQDHKLVPTSITMRLEKVKGMER
jgi:hypothetical protein